MIKVFLFDYTNNCYYALPGLYFRDTVVHLRKLSPAWRSAIVCPFYCHRLPSMYEQKK